jgi:hypothetical protein
MALEFHRQLILPLAPRFGMACSYRSNPGLGPSGSSPFALGHPMMCSLVDHETREVGDFLESVKVDKYGATALLESAVPGCET